MAKITLLPALLPVEATGRELLPVVHKGTTKGIAVADVVAPAAQPYVDAAKGAALAAEAITNYRKTIAQAVADFPVDTAFVSPEITAENPNGANRQYIRTDTAPFYALTADQPISQNVLNSLASYFTPIEKFYQAADGDNWQPAMARAVAAGARYISYQAGKTYRHVGGASLPSGMKVWALGATILADGPATTMFSATNSADVEWFGGTIDGNQASRIAAGYMASLNTEAPAFRLQNTKNIKFEGITFQGGWGKNYAVKNGDTASADIFSTGQMRNCRNVEFFGYNVQDFLWEDCTSRPGSDVFIQVNTDYVAGAVLRGLKVIRPVIRDHIRIGIEIKNTEGIVLQDVDIERFGMMAISIPNGQNARITGRIANGGSTYGVELVGEVSGARVDVDFTDITGTAVMLDISEYGHGHNVFVGGSYTRVGLISNMFRPRRCSARTLAAVAGFARGDKVWESAYATFSDAPRNRRGIVAGISATANVLYLERDTTRGYNSVSLSMAVGVTLTNGTASSAVTAVGSDSNGGNVAALKGWSRANDVVYQFTAEDSGLPLDTDSGALRPTYRFSARYTAGSAHRRLNYRGEDVLFENCTFEKMPGSGSGNYAFWGDLGATTARFRNVTVIGNGLVSYAFYGYGTLSFEKVKYSGVPTQPFSYDKAQALIVQFSDVESVSGSGNGSNSINQQSTFVANGAGGGRIARASSLPTDVAEGVWASGSVVYYTAPAIGASPGAQCITSGYNTPTQWTAGESPIAGAYRWQTVSGVKRVYQLATAGGAATANAPSGTTVGNTVTGADGYAWTLIGNKAEWAAMPALGAAL